MIRASLASREMDARSSTLRTTLILMAGSVALSVALPMALVAQGSVGAMPATYIGRANATAERVSANVARAEAVTSDSGTGVSPVTTDSVPVPTTADSLVPPASVATPAPAPGDTGDRGPAPTRAGEEAPLISFDREVYSYAAEGRRDPFKSLMSTGDLRPLVSDLRLVAVAFDPDGASVAILRDIETNEQYRVRTGNQLGRMRVASIQSRKVVFTIEEFGFSRQESLTLGDPTNARTQR